MPWDCSECGVAVEADNDPCPKCGKKNTSWALKAGSERSFTVTRRSRVQVLRGTAREPLEGGQSYDEQPSAKASVAIALTKTEAKALQDQGKLPAPKDVLTVRLWLKKREPTVVITKLFAGADPEEVEFPQTVEDPDALTHDARYLFVYGPGELPSFEGLEVVDLSEESDTGCAPNVGAGLKRNRTDLPVLHAPFGVVHAYLVDPEGDVLEDTPLEWTFNGEPAPLDLGLPAQSDTDGLISAEDLPLGTYGVTPLPSEPKNDGFQAARVPWLRAAPEHPHLQRVKWATKPVHELDVPEPQGHVHAALVDPWGRRIADESVTWFQDGAQVSEVEGTPLPAATDADGVVKASGLPLGTWAVQPTMNPERHGGYRQTELPWLRDEIDEPHLQRVKVATPPTFEDEDDAPEERYFEVSVREDKHAPFPKGARLVLEGGGVRTIQGLGADAPREGELLAVPFELVRAGQRYRLTYERDEGDPQALFEDVELHGYLSQPEQPGFRLIARLAEGTVTAATLRGNGGSEQSLEQKHGGHALDLGALASGDYVVQLEESQGGAASLPIRWNGKELELLEPGAGAGLVRLRGGSPGAWGHTFYLLSAPQARREGLFVACSADVSMGEGKYFFNLAKELQTLYRGKGYRVRDEDLVVGSSWDAVIEKLNAAAQAGAPYERLVTIGHGGWDGPIMGDYNQSSQFSGGPQYQRLVEAIQRGLSPTGKVFVSNCHTGGSDRYERREDWSRPEREPARRAFHEAQEAVEAAKAKVADPPPGQAASAQADLVVAEHNLENARADLRWQISENAQRWTEELARATGRFVAGPMGITSTQYTMQATKAILEGDGTAVQETWVTIPREKIVVHVMPNQTLAQGKRLPLDNLPAEFESEPDFTWETLPVWAPIGAGEEW